MKEKISGFKSEFEMQRQWNFLDVDRKFYTEKKIPLRIRSTGVWNRESGPDFKNAAIIIGNEKLKGDIEVHLRASDWFTHNHHHDPSYNNVVLHVVAENDLDQFRREMLPSMLVISMEELETGKQLGKCAYDLASMKTDKARELFLKAGAHRFREKTKRFTRQILIEGTEKSLWRFLFEAAGYKRNSEAFKALFKRFLTYPEDMRDKQFEAILWGESTLLPELASDGIQPELKEFARERWAEWWQVRSQNTKPLPWKNGGRPVNSPERRLALLVNWMRNFGEKPLRNLGKYAEDHSAKELLKYILSKLEVSDELWDKFVNFKTCKNKPARIGGRSFVLEAAVNVILPAIYAMTQFDLCDKPELVAERIEQAWLLLPSTMENSVTRHAGELWFKGARQKRELLNSAAARQGVIHIYREYCEKCQFDCNSCKWADSY